MTQNPPVLFVDDDENLLMGLKRKLRGKFEFDTALGPSQALDKIKAGKTYAVCVADMRMPEMDGVELLAEIAKLSPDTVNMMLTGNARSTPPLSRRSITDVFFAFSTNPVTMMT